MKIVAMTDIHGDILSLNAALASVGHPDVLILTGDLTDFGRSAEALDVIKAARSKAGRLLAIPGNCDTLEVDDVLNSEGVSLHGCHVVIDGVLFLGAGKTLRGFGTPNEIGEGDFKELLSWAVEDAPKGLPTVMAIHLPPFNTSNDTGSRGKHIGSHAFRQFIESWQPLVCFCGHVHEATGIDKIGRTRVINPGPVTLGRYAYAEIGETLETLEIRSVRP